MYSNSIVPYHGHPVFRFYIIPICILPRRVASGIFGSTVGDGSIVAVGGIDVGVDVGVVSAKTVGVAVIGVAQADKRAKAIKSEMIRNNFFM